jgi:hypothetical protein
MAADLVIMAAFSVAAFGLVSQSSSRCGRVHGKKAGSACSATMLTHSRWQALNSARTSRLALRDWLTRWRNARKNDEDAAMIEILTFCRTIPIKQECVARLRLFTRCLVASSVVEFSVPIGKIGLLKQEIQEVE